MFGMTGATGRDHGNLDRVGHRPRHRQIIAVFRAIGVHAGENDLAGPQTLDFPRPGDGLKTGGNATAVDMYFPEFLTVAINPLGVDIHNDALAAEPSRGLLDELGVAHRR